MSQEYTPPLRIREEDGSPDLIPVYQIIVSNGTLSTAGPGIVRLATGAGGGGITPPLIVGSGGTGSSTFTNRGVLIGSGAQPIEALAALNSGQLLVGSGLTLAPKIFGPGSDGQYIVAQSAAPGGFIFVDTTGAAAQVVYAATGNSYVLIANAADLTADRALTASTGIGLVDAGANSTVSLSVNSNIRDKTYGWFGAGPLSTLMFVEESRIRIPFNMQPIRMDAAVTTTASGANIVVDLLQFATPIAAGTSMFVNNTSAVNVPALFSAGSATSFDAIGTLFTGSYLGIAINQVGATVAGSNITVTLIVRTS